MSHQTYDEEWKSTQDYLSKTINLDPFQAPDRRETRTLLATLYVRYVVIANRLSDGVNQMVQPQKLRLMRSLLEGVLGRIVELKNDLVEADLCEYTHVGDVYEDLNVTPLEAELKVPICYKNERRVELEWKDEITCSVLGKLGFFDRTVEKVKMSEQQAIFILQVHERARQGRLRAQFMRDIRNMKEKFKPQADEESKEQISAPAALKIQKIWRGYVARRQTRRRKLQEMVLIGMIPPPVKQNEHIIKSREINQQRSEMQRRHIERFKAATKETRERIERTQRGFLLEQLGDEVRNWLSDYRTQTGKIPEYSTSERSTSRLLMMSRQGTESEQSKSSQVSSKESKIKKVKPKKEDKTTEEENETDCKALLSNFLPDLTARKEEYDEVWMIKDESSNPSQDYYIELIEREQTTELEIELKKVVDDMLKTELVLLQDAFDKDRGHKGRKPKKASKKTRKGGKKSKKKKEKDLTPDRSTESLLEELVANGIVKRYPQVHLSDFIGERSYWNPAPHNLGEEKRISLGDLRQLMAEFCAVPLLSNQLHMQTPHLKSLLLCGAEGSGKDMLVHAVCTEIGATLFDLTPGNIVGKYPGKSGLIMLIHLVLKVARLFQPSIIYMDNAERPFVKKVPKTDRTDPKRLKKDLPKIIKNLSPEDRIMLIGVSNCPWEGDQKLLQQVYQKYLYIPRPDYSSRFIMWTTLLRKYSAISWQFDISGVSRISDGYTIGCIVATVREVMTVKRMLQLRVHPLSPLELINALARRVPQYKEEEEALLQWWATKAPTCKRRLRAMEIMQEAWAEAQAK